MNSYHFRRQNFLTKIVVYRPSSFSEVIDLVEKFEDARQLAWYRGIGNEAHTLKPSIFRHPSKNKADDLHDLEAQINLLFDQRSPPFVNQPLSDTWERMFFMQHYGIPTRLLDWTESPFVGLYFALTSGEKNKNGTPKTDAALWMLDPIAWNRGALTDISFKGDVLDPTKEQTKSFRPEVSLEDRRNVPIMIYGTHNSPRIVAQRGMFAIFGKSTDEMEKHFEDGDFATNTLVKIVIEKKDRPAILKSLLRKGISDSTIYPDLMGLSLELKRNFGFSA